MIRERTPARASSLLYTPNPVSLSKNRTPLLPLSRANSQIFRYSVAWKEHCTGYDAMGGPDMEFTPHARQHAFLTALDEALGAPRREPESNARRLLEL